MAEAAKEKLGTRFVQLSATTSGVAEVKDVVRVAKNDFKLFKRRTLLFVDEIHRFNKLQQVGTQSLIPIAIPFYASSFMFHRTHSFPMLRMAPSPC